MQDEPLMQGVCDRPTEQLPQSLLTDGVQLLLAGTRFNIVKGAEEHERISGDLAAVIFV